MMLLARTARERRALAIGIAAVAVAVLVRAAPAWRTWVETSEASAAELSAEVVRARYALERLEATLDSLDQRKARFIDLGPAFVAVEVTPTTAAGSLASLLSGLAATADLDVRSIDVMIRDSIARGDVDRVSVSVDAAGDVRALMRFVVAIENNRTLLAIRRFSVRQPDPAAAVSDPENLRIELTVDGLFVATGERSG